MFPAAFNAETATAPYHNYTCDGCHVRNGSGIPIKPVPNPARLTGAPGPAGCRNNCFMTAGAYTPIKDYTFTGDINP